MEDDDFLDVLDVLIQKKDYLALEPYYRLDPEARDYINRPDKLTYLSVSSFYKGFLDYINDIVLNTNLTTIIKLWLIMDNNWKNVIARKVFPFYSFSKFKHSLNKISGRNIFTRDEILGFRNAALIQIKHEQLTRDEAVSLKYLILYNIAGDKDVTKSCQVIKHIFTVLREFEKLNYTWKRFLTKGIYDHLKYEVSKDAAKCIEEDY
jgi:hypothetical protein